MEEFGIGELTSTLTDSSYLPRASAFILNKSLIENIGLCFLETKLNMLY